jgi:hypothetical protein
MTDKIALELTLDELKELDKNLYYCEETWGICDKIRDAYPKSPVVESYKDWYGEYPPISPDADKRDIARWHGFQAGYNAPKEEKVSETAQERGERVHKEMEEVVRDSVKWCEEHPDTDPLDWLKPQTPEQVADGLKEAFREAVKQGVISSTKPQTLYDVIAEWWEYLEDTLNMENSIQDLVNDIEEWLPTEHETNSYKWNECIRMIRGKLR